jgi:hypothetical protein
MAGGGAVGWVLTLLLGACATDRGCGWQGKQRWAAPVASCVGGGDSRRAWWVVGMWCVCVVYWCCVRVNVKKK